MAEIIQSVVRALQILNALATHPDGLAKREVAKTVGLNISTTHHLVNTLEREGYVHRLESGNYCVGPAIARLYSAYLRSPSLHTHLLDAVAVLAELTGETAYACVWRNRSAVIEVIVEGSRAVRVGGLHVGFMDFTHLRASGKVLLAFQDMEESQAYIANAHFEPLTVHSVHDGQALRSQLRDIVVQGYAIDRGEYEDEVNCVSAPVFSAEGEVIAALTISAPEQRFIQNERSLIETVSRTAGQTSSILGFEHFKALREKSVPEVD